jgi:hypothetical protein
MFILDGKPLSLDRAFTTSDGHNTQLTGSVFHLLRSGQRLVLPNNLMLLLTTNGSTGATTTTVTLSLRTTVNSLTSGLLKLRQLLEHFLPLPTGTSLENLRQA